MKYIFIVLLVTIFIIGCTPYKVNTTSTFKDATNAIYTTKNIGTTYCVFANADVKNHEYTFIGLYKTSGGLCTSSIATLKVDTTCEITPQESATAKNGFGTLYIKQCGINKFMIYDKDTNMTKGYNYNT